MSSYTIDHVQSILKSQLEYARCHYLHGEPETYDELREQRTSVNIVVKLALDDVCPLLPSDVQDTVKQILALHEEVWNRNVSSTCNES